MNAVRRFFLTPMCEQHLAQLLEHTNVHYLGIDIEAEGDFDVSLT